MPLKRPHVFSSPGTTCPESSLTNPVGFDEVYRIYVDRVYAYLLARVSDRHTAADLTQHVFLQALAALPRYQDRGLTIGSWLFRIARNAVTDYYRSSGRRTTVSWDSIAEGLYPLDPTSLEEDAARREQVVQILQLVHDLPREKQEVLALRFAAGLRVREIAEALDRSESAIKNELSRTLHLLKEHYDARH